MLSADEINSWFPEPAGSMGIAINNITASDSVNLRFIGGEKSNHRLRSDNAALTRTDFKTKKDTNGVIYHGFLYSNSGKNPEVYIEQNYTKGDKVEFIVGSNGSAQTYVLESPSGIKKIGRYTGYNQAEKLTFFVAEDGAHKLYGVDEKLAVCRIYRTPLVLTPVTGTIRQPKSLTNYQIRFANTASGATYDVTPQGNTYATELGVGYTYELSLIDANGYVVSDGQTFDFTATWETHDITISAVKLRTISGAITGLPAEQLAKVAFAFVRPEGKIYIPEIHITTDKYTLYVEKGVEYAIQALHVNDYALPFTTISAKANTMLDLAFTPKPLYPITIAPTGATLADLSTAKFIFTNLHENDYTYAFTGTENINLRDGVYSVTVMNTGDWKQLLTSNVKVNGEAVTKTIDFARNVAPTPIAYRPEISVGTGKEFATINDALAAIRTMKREADARVTILIEPGTYEEMLLIDIDNITLKNASPTPSIELLNGGVHIDKNAVRITGYYGHGYDYFSMNSGFFWDARTLQINKENGYASTTNKGGSGESYWNSTVVVTAKDFHAENIIFENSYNQYISKKESEDVLVEAVGTKGPRPTDAGNTAVQDRRFRERACALAFTSTADRAWLNNCCVVSRQDALYGDEGPRVAINGGRLLGSVDYIFGGMTLICKNTELAMLVNEDKNDVAYLTASKTTAGRGYLFWECTVTSARPEREMMEKQPAKAGLLGRPWDANGETVFYKTRVETTPEGKSLILPLGWGNGLVASGSPRSVEYGTVEESGEDNTSDRIHWAKMPDDPILPDGTAITLFNFTKGNDGWNPFNQALKPEH